MGQYFGRKRSMMLVAPISILAFICQALAPGKEVLFLGRFLVGVGGGLVSGPVSVRFFLNFYFFFERMILIFIFE